MNPDLQPAATKTFFISLPLDDGSKIALHVMEAGSGFPLIIVPATISELDNWISMVQFMAQWFKVYFFELPGHGQSQAFAGSFTTDQVSEVVEKLADAVGAQRFSLMGFSFGGILAIKAFQRLEARIERLILIAPCLTHRSLQFSNLRKNWLVRLARVMSRPEARRAFLAFAHNKATIEVVVGFLRRIGSLEDTISAGLKQKLLQLPETTLDVLSAQLQEAMTFETHIPPTAYRTPCYFAMSSRDPLLLYKTTLAVARAGFENLNVTTLDYTFHQPPRPFTLAELNRDFGAQVAQFLVEN